VSVTSCASSFFFTTRRPPGSPLFPYTTLFRSPLRPWWPGGAEDGGGRLRRHGRRQEDRAVQRRRPEQAGRRRQHRAPVDRRTQRSEEHTSELQSRENLVCRLLLEKKKTENRLS